MAQVTGTLDDDEDDEDERDGSSVTGENVARDLYDAARVLREDPTDMQADVALGESSAAVFAADSLPDLDEDQLAAVGRVTRRLLGALGADEALEDEIRHQAEVLCRLLAPAAGERRSRSRAARARARLEAGAKEKGRVVTLPRTEVTPGGEMGETVTTALGALRPSAADVAGDEDGARCPGLRRGGGRAGGSCAGGDLCRPRRGGRGRRCRARGRAVRRGDRTRGRGRGRGHRGARLRAGRVAS